MPHTGIASAECVTSSLFEVQSSTQVKGSGEVILAVTVLPFMRTLMVLRVNPHVQHALKRYAERRRLQCLPLVVGRVLVTDMPRGGDVKHVKLHELHKEINPPLGGKRVMK